MKPMGFPLESPSDGFKVHRNDIVASITQAQIGEPKNSRTAVGKKVFAS
jgi:hypothetical protein